MLLQCIEEYQSKDLNIIEKCGINLVIEDYGVSDFNRMLLHLPMQKKSNIVKYVQNEYKCVPLPKKKFIGVNLLPLNCRRLDGLIAFVCFFFCFFFFDNFEIYSIQIAKGELWFWILEKKMGWVDHQCFWECVKHKDVKYNTREEYLIKRFTSPVSRNAKKEVALDYFVGKTLLNVWTFEEEQCLVYSLQFYQKQWNWWDFVCYLKCCWFNNRSSLDIRMAMQKLFQNYDMNQIIKPFSNCLLTDLKNNVFNLQVNGNIFWNQNDKTVCSFVFFFFCFFFVFLRNSWIESGFLCFFC